MRVSAQAQPNIALVKYWGKRDGVGNLPATGSLSVTLESLWTRMILQSSKRRKDALTVNGVSTPEMLPRVSRCLDSVLGSNREPMHVVSHSNFPIEAGLASSASAFAALVIAANRLAGKNLNFSALSRFAGEASGSAARSMYGGFVELVADSDNIHIQQIADAEEWPLEVIVAITSEGKKPVGSGEAMIRSAKTSPFYSSWLNRQDHDLNLARNSILTRDFEALAFVSERNCLKMHSVMWSSRPPIVYWNSGTLDCLQTVRSLQAEGHGVFFTIDAGPQVKAICLPESRQVVHDALVATNGVIRAIRSKLGPPARLIE